jgi:NAD(P)-dependent dehydrogenase (short-subunit alcohol dehydrogenase family)
LVTSVAVPDAPFLHFEPPCCAPLASHPFAGSAHSTSEAVLWVLTRELAADLAPIGIRVNAVCPGEIHTATLSPGTDQLVSRIPLRRLGSPTEVAAVIFYLCSAQAGYVTGAEIPVNGGQDVY